MVDGQADASFRLMDVNDVDQDSSQTISSSDISPRRYPVTFSILLCIVFLPLLGALIIFLDRGEIQSLPSLIPRLNCSSSSSSSSSIPSSLVGIAYLPHGTMILDPSRAGLPDGAAELHDAAIQISHRIAQLQPDILLMTTPHGLSVQNSTLIYLGNAAEGSSGWASHWGEYTMRVPLSSGNASHLLGFLQEEERRQPTNRSRVEGLTAWGAVVPTVIHWGETVPLYFALHESIRQFDTSEDRDLPIKALDASVAPSPPSTLILSQPIRSNLLPSPQIELGRSIRRWLHSLPSSTRVVVLLSGDLSHRHAWDTSLDASYTPDPVIFPPVGSPIAKTFDDAVGQWMKGSGGDVWTLHEGWVKDRLGGMVAQGAATCGWGGMLMMQGIMEGQTIRSDERTQGKAVLSADWELSNFYLSAPSYFGISH